MDPIEIEIDDRHAKLALANLDAKLRQMLPVMRKIAGIMHDAVEQNFEEEGRPDKWTPLAPSTIRSRAKKGKGPHPILTQEGELAKSITVHADNESAVVGTNKAYAAIHQFGGTIKHQARTQNVHFRQENFDVKRGSWAKGAKQGAQNRQRFSREGKATVGMKVKIGAHETKIPARPFLKLTRGDVQTIIDKICEYLLPGGKRI